MSATQQELEAINKNTEAINQILDEAKSISEHIEQVVIDPATFVLGQLGTDTPLKLEIAKIVALAAGATLPAGDEGDIQLKIGGQFGAIFGFNYDSGTDFLNFPMSINTRPLTFGPVNETVDFEGGDLVGTGFTVGGDVPMFVDAVNPGEGTYSLRSGIISGNQTSEAYKTVTLSDPENAIRFKVYSDTEENGDKLYFFISKSQTSGTLEVGEVYTITNYVAGDDFTNVGAISNAMGVTFIATGTTPTVWTNSSSLAVEVIQDTFSGFTPWTDVLYSVPPNTYELKWVYRKDPNVSVGDDKVQIDFFQTSEIFRSSVFNGFNQFNDINIFNDFIEFRGPIRGQFTTVNDIVVSGLRIGSGANQITSNIIIDSEVSNSGRLLSPLSSTITAIGANVISSATDAKNCTLYGSNVGRDIVDGNFLSGFGHATLRGVVNGTNVVGLGRTTSDLPSNLSNTFFVNIDGVRFITIDDVNGASLPDQTIAKITDPKDIVTKEYADSLAGGGNTAVNIAFGDSPYSASDKDVIFSDCTLGDIVINAPAPTTSGIKITVKKTDATANKVTFDGVDIETPELSLTFFSEGTQYQVI